MRWILRAVPVAILSILLCHCSDKGVTPRTVDQFSLDRPFVLEYNKNAVLPDGELSVTFRNIVSDSRCLLEMECFWVGIAEIQIEVKTTAQSTALVTLGIPGGLFVNDDDKWSVDTLGYNFRLLRLDPYPTNRLDKHTLLVVDTLKATLEISHAGGQDSLDGTVRITNALPGLIQLDPFELDSISINDDVLNISVNYGGGCKNHYFFLYMSPAAFLESYPAQANLYLQHFANYDSCKGIVHKRLKFDVRPIVDRYHNTYGTNEPFVLNVFESGSSPTGKKLSVICDDSVIHVGRFRLDQPFVLKSGQGATLREGELAVIFRDVLADSRCPFGTECYWEGIAEIQLVVRIPAHYSQLIKLGIPGGVLSNDSDKWSLDTLGYNFRLLELDPYPTGRGPRVRDAYYAMLRISQLAPNPEARYLH